MDKFSIAATTKTPVIILNPEEGVFEFSGESRPENVRQFFLPVLEWLESFRSEQSALPGSDKLKGAVCSIRFEYFNSTSAKYLLDILKAFQQIVSEGAEIDFKWLYEEEDEDMLEVGEEMSKMSKLSFEFVMVDP